MIKYLLNTDDKQYTFLKVIQTKSTNNILFKIQTKNNRTINYIQETIKKLKKQNSSQIKIIKPPSSDRNK